MQYKDSAATAVEHNISHSQLFGVSLDQADGVAICMYERTHAVANGSNTYGNAGEEHVFNLFI